MNAGHLKLSAVVPAYNVESYIDEALQSLLNQTVPFYEIIIINDGSTDSTGNVIEAYRCRDAIKIVSTENRGQGAARNVGARLARGDYLYFFDSDDMLAPDFVEHVTGLFAQRGDLEVIFFSGASFVDPGYEGDFWPNYDRGINGRFRCGMDAFAAMSEHGTCSPSPCLYVVKRSFWVKEGLEYLSIGFEDEELFLRLCAAASESWVTRDVFFHRRVRKGSIMTSCKSPKSAGGYLCAFNTACDLLENNKGFADAHIVHLKKKMSNMLMDYVNVSRETELVPKIVGPIWRMLRLRAIPPKRLLAGLVLPLSVVQFLLSLKERQRKDKSADGVILVGVQAHALSSREAIAAKARWASPGNAEEESHENVVTTPGQYSHARLQRREIPGGMHRERPVPKLR